jgi:hypothetical protein
MDSPRALSHTSAHAEKLRSSPHSDLRGDRLLILEAKCFVSSLMTRFRYWQTLLRVCNPHLSHHQIRQDHLPGAKNESEHGKSGYA